MFALRCQWNQICMWWILDAKFCCMSPTFISSKFIYPKFCCLHHGKFVVSHHGNFYDAQLFFCSSLFIMFHIMPQSNFISFCYQYPSYCLSIWWTPWKSNLQLCCLLLSFISSKFIYVKFYCLSQWKFIVSHPLPWWFSLFYDARQLLFL